jgi:hypothetical protein
VGGRARTLDALEALGTEDGLRQDKQGTWTRKKKTFMYMTRRRSVRRTQMMGATEAQVKMPKPCVSARVEGQG